MEAGATLRLMSVQERLREFHYWLKEGGWSLPTGQSIFYKIMREQSNAGRSGDGFKPDMIMVNGEVIPCRPDGGLSRAIEEDGDEIVRDSRCREIMYLLDYIPEEEARVFAVIYLGPEIREATECASVLKVSKGKYYELRAGLMGWFKGAMFRIEGVTAPC